MIVPKYFEDFDHLHVNTMPNRAYYIPASRRMEDLVENREASDRFFLLSGDWKFRYFTSVYDVKEEFFAEGYDTSAFETIPVPSVWQNYGHDHHQYTNVRYPFPVDPPYVPYENPCGAYVRTFEWKKQEEAPRAFLNFEGVDSCFYVWMNGRFVGYSQVSHSTSEFDVTDFLKDGTNTIAVLVLKWCDGSYLEDQDKFRMSGIFRDVYLLARPEKGIRDYFVKAAPDASYQNGEVSIAITWNDGEPQEGTAKLFDIRLMQNFNSPYFAASVKEFWSRWHISLSTWFRDYVYIPLGGNRVGKLRHCANLLVTFLVSGLWHGAAFTYIIWGGLHGMLQILENSIPLFRAHIRRVKEGTEKKSVLVISRLVTFFLVMLAWVFFRAGSVSQAVYILWDMWTGIGHPLSYLRTGFAGLGLTLRTALELALPLALLAVYDACSLHADPIRKTETWKPVLRWSFYYGFMLLVILLASFNAQEFVYFQF